MCNAAAQLRAQLTLREELLSALSHLRFHDVRSFLLGSDAALDVSIVKSPSVASRAVALEATTISEAVSSAPFDGEFAFNLVTEWLFVPAMERDAYSLGVHLCRDDARTPAGNFKPVIADARFCRYAKTTGAYVSVSFRGSDTELCYFPSGKSPRHKGGKWFRFNSQTFQAVVASIDGADAVPDVDALLECLNVVYTFDEMRHCPVCDALPADACECREQPAPGPALSIRDRFKSRRGQYAGDAVVEFLVGGSSFRSVGLHRRSSFDLSENRELCKEVVAWATCDRLSVLNPSLTKLVMPANAEEETQPPTILSGASSTMGFEPEVIHEAEVDFTNIPVHDDADQEQFAAVSEPLLISTGGILLDMSSRNAPNNVPRRPRSPPAAIHPQPSTPSTGISNNYMAPIHGLSNAAVVHLPTPSPSDSQPGSRLPSPPDPASSQEIPNNNTDNITRGLQVIKDHGGTTNIAQEQLQSIVPMEDDEIWRTFRRARCREAAAFSNLRRKIKLQTLRSNLVDVRRRNKECTERFHVLLHENRALRAAVEAGKAAAGE